MFYLLDFVHLLALHKTFYVLSPSLLKVLAVLIYAQVVCVGSSF